MPLPHWAGPVVDVSVSVSVPVVAAGSMQVPSSQNNAPLHASDGPHGQPSDPTRQDPVVPVSAVDAVELDVDVPSVEVDATVADDAESVASSPSSLHAADAVVATSSTPSQARDMRLR
jgi:hypothetical protein